MTDVAHEVLSLAQMTVAQRIDYYAERKQARDIDGRPRVSDAAQPLSDYDPLLEALVERGHNYSL